MMRHYCTYFDHNYLARGLALHSSLKRHSGRFSLHVLCLSNACYEALKQLALPEIIPIALEDFECGDTALLTAKSNRSRIEYYFTCTPSLPRHVFNHFPDVDMVTYLDSDLYFFSDPEQVFRQIGDCSIAITPHRFPPALKGEERHGIYNVGWLTFRRDTEGLDCMEHWREQCLEWCYDRCEEKRYADQKYLDAWPEQFRNLKILDDPGVNAAPWNLPGSEFTLATNERVQVNGRPLVFFHFHGLKRLAPLIYDSHWESYDVHPNTVLRQHVYGVYLQDLEKLKSETKRLRLSSEGNIRSAPKVAGSASRRAWRNSRLRRFWHGVLAWWGMLRGRNLLVVNGRLIR